MTQRNSYFFPTILLLSSVGYFATDIYLPSFPAIETEFQSSKSLVQLSLSLYLAGWALSQLVYGPLSDRSGRKKIVLLSLALGFVGTVLCIFSPNIFSLILGRIFQGVGLGGTSVLFRAILRDAYSGDELAHYGAFIAIATAMFIAIAPSLGGYIQHFLDWRVNFFLVALYILALLFAVIRFVPETNQHQNPFALRRDVLWNNYLHILKNPIFLGYTIVSSLTLGGLSAYLTASPFLFERVLNLSPVQYGSLAWIIGGGFGLGGICSVFLVKKMGRHRTLVVGIAVIFLSGLGMLFPSLFGFLNTMVIMLPMALFSLGASMCFANCFAAAFQPFAKIAGSAGALYGCLQVLGGSLASGLMSLIQETTQTPLALILILVGLFSYFSQYWSFSHVKKESL